MGHQPFFFSGEKTRLNTMTYRYNGQRKPKCGCRYRVSDKPNGMKYYCIKSKHKKEIRRSNWCISKNLEVIPLPLFTNWLLANVFSFPMTAV